MSVMSEDSVELGEGELKEYESWNSGESGIKLYRLEKSLDFES